MSVPLSPRQQAQQTRRQLRAQRYEDADAELREALDLAAEFAGMVRKQVAVPLTEWLV